MAKKKKISETIQTVLRSAGLLEELLALPRFPSYQKFEEAWKKFPNAGTLSLKDEDEVIEFCDCLNNGVVTITCRELLGYHNSLKSEFVRPIGGITPPAPKEWTP